jgi:hypothetical protein
MAQDFERCTVFFVYFSRVESAKVKEGEKNG